MKLRSIPEVGDDGRWDVPTSDALARLVGAELPLELRATSATQHFVRDVYFDTEDLALTARGVSCVVRRESEGRQRLLISRVTEGATESLLTHVGVDIDARDEDRPFTAHNEATRLLRAVVNPDALKPNLELEIERLARIATSPWWWRPAKFAFAHDTVTVRVAALARAFHEVTLHELTPGRPSGEELRSAFNLQHSLRTITLDRRQRGEQLRAALESEALTRRVGSGRWIVLVVFDGARVAALRDRRGWKLPSAEGSGEEAGRHLLRNMHGSGVGELHLLKTVQGDGRIKQLEVWTVTRADHSERANGGDAVKWIPVDALIASAGSSTVDDAATVAALSALARSDALARIVALPVAQGREQGRPPELSTNEEERKAKRIPLLDGDLSLLAFNVRVLAIAQDAATPLLERLRYIAIVASNLDEFFSVRGGRLKYAGEFAADDGETSNDSRHVVTVNRAARVLIEAQYAATKEIFAALDARGLRIRAVSESGQATRERLRTRFRSDIFPVLTPRAITATPGHSLPVVADRLLSFAVILRDGGREGEQLAELTIPTALDRFIELPDGEGYVATEDVIRQHLSLLYPGRRVVEAHLFRVTRFADFELDEQRAGNLVQAVDEHARQRRHQPIVRIEVEREMPRAVREMLLRELALEPGARPGALGDDDIFEIPGLMNLEALHDLAGAPLPGLSFPKFTPRNPLAGTSSLWDAIREDDLMFHHPYDDFSTSVVHFFENAAADPDVLAIRVALYRTGDRSPIADALRRAAEAGKQVTVFVELKARFDEERNVRWTRRLEESGVHVVHGLPGYKNHSKIALVARREAGGTRRYAHIGTGNYNAATARIYTDLGILTAREEVCDDISDLFNSLTGSSVPSPIAYRACLVAPHAMLPGLVQRIEREAANARAGCPARIRMKINGLADQEIVRALYDASRAGVDIDLGVRGICTLRPGVEGSSERIRVTSIVGRFLEHARIYAFHNDGHPEWFIGSADLRPRNLRRRVEVLVPIVSAQHRARLDAILETELRDPTAWTLGSNGDYTRTAGRVGHEGMSAQSRFARDADSSLREGVT